MILADLHIILPELIIVLGSMALLMLGVFRGDRSFNLLSILSVLILAGAGIAVMQQGPETFTAFNGAYVTDDFARFAKLLILLGSAISIGLSQTYLKNAGIARFEFPILILFATLGMLVMVSSGNFITLYLGLELQNLALYVLAAFRRDTLRSSEAGLKYFVLSALSSGLLLFGISYIYGFTGSTDFKVVADVIAQSGVSIGLVFGLVFLLAGLAFKVSAAPFHMWTPDVYEGAPTPVTAFFSMSPKVAGMVLFLRAVLEAFPGALHEWQQVVVVIAVLSMALGAISGIGQNNIKRLMAYSSISHMGFALVGLATGTIAGVQGVLLYLLIYIATNAGVFGCILAMRRQGQMVEHINDLAGLARTQPRMAFIFSMLMFSLAGIPPLAGFFAKFYVFLAAIESGLYVLAVLGVLSSVIGAFYYLRIVKIIYFDEPAPAFDRGLGVSLTGIIAASAAFSLLFVVVAGPVVQAAGQAAQSLLP